MATVEHPPGSPPPPPHNLEAEQSVLGAILLSDRTMYALVIEEGLQPEDFYRPQHGAVFAAMRGLYDDGQNIDVVTLTERLRQAGELDGIGGEASIHVLSASVPAAGHARHYAQIVRENALVRRLLTATYEIQASVWEHDAAPRELVEHAERQILEVAHDDRQKDFRTIHDVLDDELDKLHQLSVEGTSLTGIPSGFSALDEITGGFQRGNLVILAARPSLGKSALVSNIAENASVDHGHPVALFSLEMSETELAQRFVASQASIKGDELRKGRVAENKWPKILKATNELSKAPLYIDDSSDVGLLEMRAKARRLHAQSPLGLIIVDYLQLMRTDGRIENRAEQIGQISRGLKLLARELEVPVIALSQLNRGVEARTDKRPLLSDLRESGCLTGDSRVYIADTGGYRRMDELVGTSGFQVLALDPKTWRVEPRRVTRAFSTGRKPVNRLTTRLGRSIRATGNHRFMTIEGWQRLDELEPGDRVALPRRLPTVEAQSMSAEELALLGHLIGDGCTLPRHAIQYTTNESKLAEIVAELASAVFGDRVRPRIVKERQWLQVYLAAAGRLSRRRRNPVAEWLDRLGVFGLRSHEKRVPDGVFAHPSDLIAIFLRHLWSTDGCLWLGRGGNHAPAIYYASSSVQLARDVQSLLLRLGINARVRRASKNGPRPHWHVVVSGGPDSRAFLRLVGGLGDKKSHSEQRILEWLDGRTTNTNRDIIPRSVWQTIAVPAMQHQGLTTREMQSGIDTAYCGTTLYKANLSRERAERVAEVVESPELERLAHSDVYWDEIATIEPAGEEEVYDLTVEGLHNFVADDIIVHNSIEQDADLVMFIYRDEIYHEDSEAQGIAEIGIAKHRNGAVGRVELVFQKEYPRFMNLQHEL